MGPTGHGTWATFKDLGFQCAGEPGEKTEGALETVVGLGKALTIRGLTQHLDKALELYLCSESSCLKQRI